MLLNNGLDMPILFIIVTSWAWLAMVVDKFMVFIAGTF